MFNFFIDSKTENNDFFVISGEDFFHIKNVLRMKVGDELLVSNNGVSHLCSIKSFEQNSVTVSVVNKNYQTTDLPIKIYLFQGLPKSDKMELIIQKAVELGVSGIYPVQMRRSIVKLDKKNAKTSRWQSIAESAAKQSKRSVIPTVFDAVDFKDALNIIKDLDLFIFPFESKNGMEDTKTVLSSIKSGMSIGVMIGPEGGFDDNEVEQASQIGAKIISLGQRILRTETAAITTLSMLMLYSEMCL